MTGRRPRSVTAAAVGFVCLAGLVAAPPGALARAAVPLSDCVHTDNGDPVITELEVSPRRVDLTNGTRAVQVRVRMHDTGGPGPATGVTSVKVFFREANLGATRSWTMVREGGGIWSVTARLGPGTIAAGRLVANFVLSDYVRTTVWDGSDSQRAGLVGDVRVRNRTEPDTSRPRMTAFGISPVEVDTRVVEKTVMFRARVVDDFAGVGRITVYPSTDRGQVPSVRLSLVRGSRRDGVWTGGISASTWAGIATWHTYVKIFDRAGNRRLYGRTAMRAGGFPHLVRVMGRTDTQPPTVRLRPVVPPSVDVTRYDVLPVIDAAASDSSSGVEYVGMRLRDPRSSYVLAYTSFARTDGTAMDGTWRTVLAVHRCYSTSGPYDVELRAVDAAGNARVITVPSALDVTAGDTSIGRPSLTTPSPPGRVEVSFPEDVTGLSTSSGLVTRHTDDTGPAEPGTWTCADTAGSAVDCEQGWLRSATFVPTEALSAGAGYGLVLNPEHVLDVRDRAGNAYHRDTTLFKTIR